MGEIMVKVLFASYGGGHIKAILPVIEKLRADKDYDCQVLALNSATNECRARHIPYKTLRDFVHLYPPDMMVKGRELAAELTHSTLSPEESAAYLGIGFYGLCQELGEDADSEAYRTSGRQAFCPTHAMEMLLSDIKSDIVITTNAPRFEKALQQAARNLGIASLCLVDFYPGAELEWLATPNYGTRVCVIDEFVKNQLVEKGRDVSDIVVTGNPAFDHYGTAQASEEANRYRNQHMNGAERIIAYASNLEPDDGQGPPLQERLLDFLEKECAALGYRLSLRRHPSERSSVRPPNVLDGNVVSLETFMASADAMITFPSTVAYEARLLGTPVIVLGMSRLASDAGYWHTGEYRIAEYMAMLGQMLKDVPKRPEQKPFLQRFASDKVIDVMKKIACNL